MSAAEGAREEAAEQARQAAIQAGAPVAAIEAKLAEERSALQASLAEARQLAEAEAARRAEAEAARREAARSEEVVEQVEALRAELHALPSEMPLATRSAGVHHSPSAITGEQPSRIPVPKRVSPSRKPQAQPLSQPPGYVARMMAPFARCMPQS